MLMAKKEEYQHLLAGKDSLAKVMNIATYGVLFESDV